MVRSVSSDASESTPAIRQTTAEQMESSIMAKMREEFDKLHKRLPQPYARSPSPGRQARSATPDDTCFKCQQKGHFARQCVHEQQPGPTDIICQLCNKKGHDAHICRSKRPASSPGRTQCQLCGTPGHIAKECKKGRLPSPALPSVSRVTQQSVEDLNA